MAGSTRPNIARAKRAGLDLDLAEVCRRGPAALEPDDHYRLKTYGVCAQRHADLFMLRMRVTAGRLDRAQVAAVSEAARRYAGGWLHLTTRQNIELHSVRLEDVTAIHALLEPAGLVGRSVCGHVVRNVMACAGAATSADEPFDVTADAMRLSDLLVARSTQLNVALPGRVNIVLGGCHECARDALSNDIGLVAVIRHGEPGYELWTGGSIGSAPRLSKLLVPFLARHEVWPAVWAIFGWFMDEGDIDQVAKGRLKFLLDERGDAAFRQAFAERFAALRHQPQPPITPVALNTAAAVDRMLAVAPPGGWRDGIRPERRPGLATVVVRASIGDLLASDLDLLSDLSPDGVIVLTREQNVALSSVPLDAVEAVVAALAKVNLGPDGSRRALDVRACPGLSFCSLAITGSQPVALAVERALQQRLDLPGDAEVAVSGCPNSCTKHQTADVGLAGAKVRVSGEVGLGYHLFLGADLDSGVVGEPVLRLLEDEVPGAVVALTEMWLTLRRPHEPMGRTFRRIGLDTIANALAARLRPVADQGDAFASMDGVPVADPSLQPDVVSVGG